MLVKGKLASTNCMCVSICLGIYNIDTIVVVSGEEMPQREVGATLTETIEAINPRSR